MAKFKIPSGIVPLFRLFVLIRLIFSLFMLLNFVIHPDLAVMQDFAFAGPAECLLLAGYLSWPWLERRLGRLYLPLGLFVATLAPWVENQLLLNGFQRAVEQGLRTLPANVPGISSIIFIAMQIQLLFVLFIPVVLISWRYSLKWVFITSLGLAALDIGYFLITSMPRQSFISGPLSSVVARTLLFFSVGFVVARF